MWLSQYFFSYLLFYSLLLIFTTISRKYIGYRGIFTIFTIFLFFFLSFLTYTLDEFVFYSSVSLFVLNVGHVGWFSLDISISLKVDFLSFLFTYLVLIIALATNFYITNYLKYEAHEDVFTLLINWFVFSMVVLVLSNNLFTLFLGWESIGLSSFFLINFWSTRRGTVKSSFKAFFFNKLSDVLLFLFLIVINSVTFLNDLTLISGKLTINISNITDLHSLAMYCLTGCALFKSAQLFGHLWLPDSMEAPVPASALIHSATLVSAGIYLLLRFTTIVTLTNFQSLIIFLGSITAAYGGLVSSSQTDMKKLLAYSTISHCGFLFVTVGTEVYTASIIYLFMHGLFKASTFFCAGSFIRVSGSQDTRNMGSLNRILPVDTAFLIICVFNLAGLPFSFGYLYKSSLINSIILSSNTLLVFGFCLVGLLCSVVYAYRLVYYSAFDTSKEFFPNVVYELQQKHINVTTDWSLTTIVQIISIVIIFFFSIYIYIYFTSSFLNSELTVDQFPILIDCNQNISFCVNSLYKNYYELFYSMYFLIIVVIAFVGWRQEFTFLFKLNFYLFLLITSIFTIIFTSML